MATMVPSDIGEFGTEGERRQGYNNLDIYQKLTDLNSILMFL